MVGSNKMTRYGKSIFDILNAKSDFFGENEKYLTETKNVWEIYKKQPQRTQCKLCGNKIGSETLFSQHGVDFLLCERCNHINGAYQDTSDFSESVYSGGGGDVFIL